jgi:hypothetical protein
MSNQKFPSGRILATLGALELAESGVNLFEYLRRHIQGDWGDICESDRKENEFSVVHGYRIFSAYNTSGGKLWLITEADRSATTFLLPAEY